MYWTALTNALTRFWHCLTLALLFNTSVQALQCPDNMEVDADINQCEAFVAIPAPESDIGFSYFARLVFTDINIQEGSRPQDVLHSWPNIPNTFDHVFPLGTTEIFIEYSNENGTSDCTFQITVADQQNPAFINCPENITQNTDLGQCGAIVDWVAPTLTDNCSLNEPATVNISPQTFFDAGTTTTIIYQGQDASANPTTCIFTVSIIDNEKPQLTCPEPITGFNETGLCAALISWDIPVPNDNCSIASFNGNHQPNSYFSVGTTIVNYTTSDVHGNNQNCNFSIIVIDNEKPQITCPAPITVFSEEGLCSALISWDIPIPTDNCFVASSISNHQPGNYYDVGTTTVTYTVNDIFSNSQTCDFNITVIDNEKPQITCPQPITVFNDEGLCAALISWNIPTPTDNCQVASSTPDKAPNSYFDVGTTMVTYTVNDIYNNVENCNFSVTVMDNEKPKIVCPAPITVFNDEGLCAALVAWDIPIPTDNCAVASSISDRQSNTFFDVGITPVTYTVKDIYDNTETCTFTITVLDNEKPAMTCPAPITLFNDEGLCAAFISWDTPIPTDNCQMASLTVNHPPNNYYDVGTTVVTYTAKDIYDNTRVCDFNITVIDNEEPALVCPAPINVSNDLGLCAALIQWDVPQPADNCAIQTFTASHQPNNYYDVGTTTINYYVEDIHQNSKSCSFTITVTDDEKPQITCPPSIEIPNDYLVCGAFVPWTVPTPTDNCGVIASFTSNFIPNDYFPIGTTVVGYEVSDPVGNMESCQFTITVNDTAPPELMQPLLDKNVDTQSGDCGRNVHWNIPDWFDNCGIASVIASHQPNDFFPVGTTTVQYTATDIHQNATTASFEVTVSDNEAPTLLGDTPNLEVAAEMNQCGANVNFVLPEATDNCGIAFYTSSHNPGDFFEVGQGHVVELMITDIHGNVLNRTFTIDVVDNEIPQIVACAPDFIALGGVNCGLIFNPSQDGLLVEDNCDFSIINDAPDELEIGVNEITWTVTDVSGNTSSCLQIIELAGAEELNVACGNEISITLNDEENTALPDWNIPAAVTGCAACQNTDLPDFKYLGTFEGHQYFISSQRYRWSTAQTLAEENQGYLTTISTLKENEFIADLMPQTTAFFGLNDAVNENTLEWANGEVFNLAALPIALNNSSSRDYAVLHQNGEWTLEGNNSRHHFILEKPCIDIERITEPLDENTPIGTYEVGYRYTSLCGEVEECYFPIHLQSTTNSEYCQAGGRKPSHCSTEEAVWIEKVQFGLDFNSSEDDGGYGDFSHFGFPISASSSYSFLVTPNEAAEDLRLFAVVWVDWNKDGDFYDDNELLLKGSLDEISTISIPENMTGGNYRMRVAMSNRKNLAPCGSFELGEVEDYTLGIVQSLVQQENDLENWIPIEKVVENNSNAIGSLEDLNNGNHISFNENISLFPNPATNEVFLRFEQPLASPAKISIYHANGVLIAIKKMQSNEPLVKLDLAELNVVWPGLYFISVEKDDGIKKIFRLVKQQSLR